MCTLFPDYIWIHEITVAPSTVSQPRPPSAIKGCWISNIRFSTLKKIAFATTNLNPQNLGVTKRRMMRKNWFFKIRPEFRCRISRAKLFSDLNALGHQYVKGLGSHQGPWTPWKVWSEFKVFCGSCVMTSETRFASEICVFSVIGVGVDSIIIYN